MVFFHVNFRSLFYFLIIISLFFIHGQSHIHMHNPLINLLHSLHGSHNNNNNNNNDRDHENHKYDDASTIESHFRRVDPNAQSELETNFLGSWEIVNPSNGIAAMHMNLLPNNKIIMYDASAYRVSAIKLANGVCVPYINKDTGATLQDCFAHGLEYDFLTNKIRTLKILYDAWCSSASLGADGTLVSTGGWNEGIKTIRYISGCPTCEFKEFQTSLADPRWYATQITLQDGRFFVVGGRKAYSYEIVSAPGQNNAKSISLPFLDETTDLDENNLYPFVHLSTDGNIFIFANNRSILLDLNQNKVVKEFPILQGGARNYPASGMSALIPIKLYVQNPKVIPAEVIVCGGAKQEAYNLAGKQNFLPALQDCNRLQITDSDATWKTEQMPSNRVMGDMLILPNTDLLILNGAHKGTAAWYYAEEPNFTPLLYKTDKPLNQRFKLLNPTKIPRMYHSTSALLPNGKILVAGSNTNSGYNFTYKYPTELRVESFSPPYLDPALKINKPGIITPSTIKMGYETEFKIQFKLGKLNVDKVDITVTMLAPPFTTHGYSMNQRMLILGKVDLDQAPSGTYEITLMAPPSGVVAPPGFYLLFVVYRGVPSEGIWGQIK